MLERVEVGEDIVLKPPRREIVVGEAQSEIIMMMKFLSDDNHVDGLQIRSDAEIVAKAVWLTHSNSVELERKT